MFDAMHIRMPGGKDGERVSPLDQLVALPEDLEAWVLAETG
jgi:hypothetical protein